MAIDVKICKDGMSLRGNQNCSKPRMICDKNKWEENLGPSRKVHSHPRWPKMAPKTQRAGHGKQGSPTGCWRTLNMWGWRADQANGTIWIQMAKMADSKPMGSVGQARLLPSLVPQVPVWAWCSGHMKQMLGPYVDLVPLAFHMRWRRR